MSLLLNILYLIIIYLFIQFSKVVFFKTVVPNRFGAFPHFGITKILIPPSCNI